MIVRKYVVIISGIYLFDVILDSIVEKYVFFIVMNIMKKRMYRKMFVC